MGRQTTKSERLQKLRADIQLKRASLIRPRVYDDLDLHAKQVLSTLTDEQARAVGLVLSRVELENRRLHKVCTELLTVAEQAVINSEAENLRRTKGIRAAGVAKQAEDAAKWMQIARAVMDDPPSKRVARFNALSYRANLREPGDPLGDSQRAEWIRRARAESVSSKS